MTLIDREFVSGFLPRRSKNAHKGDNGRILIVAGSVGYTGAARLCARGAVRAGAGLVSVGTPRSCWPVLACAEPEPMPFPVPEDESGRISVQAAGLIAERLELADVCVCGPGLGQGAGTEAAVKKILSSGKPSVIDADGINAATSHIYGCTRVLTPHEGEFLRAGGDLTRGRAEGAADFAARNNCVLVLKGPGTIVASPGGRLMRNTTGNPGLAKGGSGDLLAGMIGAFMGQGLPAFEAAAAAVWLHGRAGDICARRLGEVAMTPSDVADALPRAILECV